jgi:dipeptidase
MKLSSRITLVKIFLSYLSLALLFLPLAAAQSLSDKNRPDWLGRRPDGCTSITVGKLATADGSVITSHTCDSHRTEGNLNIIPARTYKTGTWQTLLKRTNDDSLAMPAYKYIPSGRIEQPPQTHGYINTAYPCMNDQQLAIGESTFGGRSSLLSPQGLIDCQQLVRLMIERCSTARAAIKLADQLTRQYGWSDEGECLTIADKNEVWHLEIVGCGPGQAGAIWAAQRVPDDHISVNANASRIRQINLEKPDYFMASANIYQVAQDSGWWNPAGGSFEFCYAYDPEGRTSFAARRREWRVLSLAAPSLKLDANAENFPFSVKPDSLITIPKLVRIFQDYYEGTDYNFIKDLTWVNDKGQTEISPLANPFMPYDMNKLFRINGGWGWLGERTIARWYTMYATITQSRSWLPDPIGGVVWLAWDNVATSIYIPLYCSIKDVSSYYKTPARVKGFSRDSAWWAFNHLGTLAAQRWGDMRYDVSRVWQPWQQELFEQQPQIEAKALILYKQKPDRARTFLTGYAQEWGDKVVQRAWKLGEQLWTKYDEKF